MARRNTGILTAATRDFLRVRPIRSGLIIAATVLAAAADVEAQAPLVPAPQPRPAAGVPDKPAEEQPKRSRHGRSRRATGPSTHWGYYAGRPAVVAAPFYAPAGIWPSAVGHPSRPVVSPMWSLNTVRHPSYSPYIPGRPTAAPMAAMTLLTPHYVVRISPSARWLGSGYLRTARKDQVSPKQ